MHIKEKIENTTDNLYNNKTTMTIIDYIDTANGYTHHILVPDYNMPFLFWLFMVIAGGSIIFTLINRMLGK